jgi:hypothetical protein
MISPGKIAGKSRTTAPARLNVTTVSSDTTNDLTHFSATSHSRLTAGQGRQTQTRKVYLFSKVTNMAFNTGGRKCKFESLENRQMMAGDVVASVHAGTLFIKGDNLSNGITITAGAIPNQVIITGTTVAGSGTTVNGLTNTPVAVNNVTRGMRVNMLGGNDTVNAHNLTINGVTKIKGGDGLDTINLTSATFNSSMRLKLGPGADVLNITATVVQAETNITGGANFDDVTIVGSDLGALHTNLNDGNDNLDISNTQVTTVTTLEGGKGINTFVNGGSNFFGSLYIKRHLDG